MKPIEYSNCAIKVSVSSHKRQSASSLLIPCLLLLPCLAWAEGAVRVFDCNVTQACDAEGACETTSDQINFRMTPGNLREDGSGDYQVSYRDVEADMNASSDAGPFYWTTGNERNTLLASSETHFLWHKLTLAPTPTTNIYFLSCMLRQ